MKRTDASGVRRGLTTLTLLLALGVVIGLASGLLAVMLKVVERFMMGYSETADVPGPYAVASWRRVTSVVLGSLFAGFIWWLLRTRTRRVPSVSKAVEGESLPVWQTTVHVLLQIFIVGSGSSIGREVAPREFAAMLAQRMCEAFGIDGRQGRAIVACAAAAGLAGVYDAPLAGAFFAVEILLVDISIRTVALALGMCAVSAYVASFIKGDAVFYDMRLIKGSIPDWRLVVFAVICGVCAGMVGLLFRKASSWAQTNQAQGIGIVWQMPMTAMFTGVVAIWLPQVMGNGRTAAQFAFSTAPGGKMSINAGSTPATAPSLRWVALVMLAVLLAKMALTVLTIRSGASGGVLQPGIALGAVLGGLLGILAFLVFPGFAAHLSVTACALVGAAGLLSVSQQAPLMAMSLVMELTNAPSSYLLPMAITSVTGLVVSWWLEASFSSRPQLKESRCRGVQGKIS